MGVTEDGQLSNSPTSACILCGKAGGGHEVHITSCPPLHHLHTQLEQEAQGAVPANDLDRANLLLCGDGKHLAARIKFATGVRQALEDKSEN